jgi:hypothetical protein
VIVVSRQSVVTHRPAAILWLLHRRFELLVFNEQIVDRFPKKDCFCDSGFGGELIEERTSVWFEVQRLQMLFPFQFGSHD